MCEEFSSAVIPGAAQHEPRPISDSMLDSIRAAAGVRAAPQTRDRPARQRSTLRDPGSAVQRNAVKLAQTALRCTASGMTRLE